MSAACAMVGSVDSQAEGVDGRDFAGTARFQIERTLGAGGMGVVYQVRDGDSGARLALKTLRVTDGVAVDRLKREFRAVANVSHPNLARLDELHHHQGQWFFTLELLEGGESFVDHVRPGGRLDEGRLRAALGQLVAGLSALHQGALVHRDVKPSNVLVTGDGRVVLLDFGLVAPSDRPEGSAGMAGTAVYMAPEQARGEPPGPAADWYSVGVMLYQALTGELPFSGSSSEILRLKQSSDGPPPALRVSGLPADLADVCGALLRCDPARRPGGAEVARRLSLPATERADRPSGPDVFVGRREELATLRDAFGDSSRARRLVTVAVHGESGLGKSALVRTFLEELKRSAPEVVILEGRCHEREFLPYKAFDGVVDALARHLCRLEYAFASVFMPRDTEALACLFPALRRVPLIASLGVGGAPGILDRQELRARAFAALRELLARLGDRQPVVVSIDDVHWADADSLLLLEDLRRAPEPPPVFLVLTSRTGAAVASLPGDVRHLRLGPLARPDAETLATQLLGDGDPAGPWRDEDARALAVEAGGHPLFLGELVRHLCSSPVGRERRRVRLEEALSARIERLPPPARALLELLAVAGAPVRGRVAARASRLDGASFAAWNRALRAAQLLRGSGSGPSATDTVEPYHDRIREAVLGRLSPEARRDHHRHLADALDACGADDPEALVRHLLAAGEARRAAGHAERAAAHAASVLAFDRAAELYRVAVRLEDGSPARAPAKLRALRRSLAHALVCRGRGAEAAEQYRAAAAEGGTAPDDEAVDLQRLAFEQLLLSGRIDEGMALAGTVLSQVGLKLAATPRAALWSLLRARARLRLRGLRYRARPPGESAPADLVRIDACWSASMGLAVVDFIRAADFATRHLLLALDAGEPYRIARALANEACFSAAAGGRAQRRTARLLMLAMEAGDLVRTPRAQALASFAAGSVAMMEGRWRKARHHLTAADQVYRERCADVTGEVDGVDVDLLIALAYLGELAELRQRLRGYLRSAEERGDLYAATLLRTSEPNLAWLADDDPTGARREARAAVEGYSPEAVIVRAYLDPLAQARIDLYQGDGARAWQRVNDHWPAFRAALLDRVQLLRVAMTNLRGTAALASAGGRAERLAQAVGDARRLRRESVPWATGLGTLLEAGVRAARGDQAGALSGYTQAAVQLEEADMSLHAACARWHQGELLGGDAGAALVAAARAFMERQSVRNPLRLRAVIAPR
jgi:eukaryotic-like serine/threonine-protein kinase